MSFSRNLSSDLIDNLKNREELFNKFLLPDIKKCDVFPAIRDNELHFYYKGGRLFKYAKNRFISHIKYAFVCPDCQKNGDINESALEKIERITKFTDGYERIKENCAKYNEDSESEYVARLFKKYSVINNNPKDDIVLLDIEAAFSNKESKTQDRFDIVLLNTKTNVLKVVEAKLYENPELHPSSASNPKVIEQIQRYEKKIKEKKDEIINAYSKYIQIMNDLFGTNINSKITLDEKVGLLYFCFNDATKKSETFKSLESLFKTELPQNKIYPVGNTKDCSLKLFF